MPPPPPPSPSLLRYLTRINCTSCNKRRAYYALSAARKFSDILNVRSPRSPQSPKAFNKVRDDGSRVKKYAEGKEREEFDHILVQRELCRDFGALGVSGGLMEEFSSAKWLTGHVLELMRDGLRPSTAANYYSGIQDGSWKGRSFSEGCAEGSAGFPYLKQLQKPMTIKRAIHILGRYFHRDYSREAQRLGKYMLEVSLLMGNESSAIFLVAEAANPTADLHAPGSARQMVQFLVEQGTSWEALALRAQELLWPVSRQPPNPAARAEGHRLAENAFLISSPGSPERNPHVVPGRRILAGPLTDPDIGPPWKLLARMTEQSLLTHLSAEENHAIWKRAIRAGALAYDDPDAGWQIAKMPDVVVPYSDEWLLLVTKAAMNGSANASYLLGRYYLELNGWYPCKGRVPPGNDTVGFSWLDISMAQAESPKAIRQRALVMAFVYRENGELGRGLECLRTGVERVHGLVERTGVGGDADVRLLEGYAFMWDGKQGNLPPGMDARFLLQKPLLGKKEEGVPAAAR